MVNKVRNLDIGVSSFGADIVPSVRSTYLTYGVVHRDFLSSGCGGSPTPTPLEGKAIWSEKRRRLAEVRLGEEKGLY